MTAATTAGIMVGGAVLTPDYAQKIGADFYAKDAKEISRHRKESSGLTPPKNRKKGRRQKLLSVHAAPGGAALRTK